jgi:hypothetical protein
MAVQAHRSISVSRPSPDPWSSETRIVSATSSPRFVKETNGPFTLGPVLDEVRAAIAGEGFAGLERLPKNYGIAVILLSAGLGTGGALRGKQ